MTALHNMSVPPRSVLTVQREEVRGRRYRVAIGKSVMGSAGWSNDAVLTRCFREDGAACALALLTPRSTAVSTDEFRKRSPCIVATRTGSSRCGGFAIPRSTASVCRTSSGSSLRRRRIRA